MKCMNIKNTRHVMKKSNLKALFLKIWKDQIRTSINTRLTNVCIVKLFVLHNDYEFFLLTDFLDGFFEGELLRLCHITT